ncbi:hypothetical protein V3851_17485 [Paenibacillus sp. M1]|uniref:DUF4025 domain-containing protein n=1 Tax=Paenibacillus haidiansis TaxID=1574488 RepID=A0ABU7VV34_9BACL
MPDFPKTEGDFVYERYNLERDNRAENDIPGDDLLPHDTRITQGLSERGAGEEGDADYLADTALPDVPDADEIERDTPVDQVAPDPDAMHGTDLLNGFDGDETR